ncbi:MAG: glycoside hydrolase family 65 protein [Chloroflexi bacterium]|nr:glycoside hydrolase family 65 protein [Chloroflexota bacterium]
MKLLVSDLTDDQDWLLRVAGFDRTRERGVETLLTVGHGYAGTRGSLEEGSRASLPGTFLAGVFDPIHQVPDPPDSPAEAPALVVAPNWLALALQIDDEWLSLDEQGLALEHERVLDMRHGVVVRHWRHRQQSGRTIELTTLRCALFLTGADRHVFLQRAWIAPEMGGGRLRLTAALDGRVTNALRPGPPLVPVRSAATPTPVLLLRTPRSHILLAMAQSCSLRGPGLVDSRREVPTHRGAPTGGCPYIRGPGLVDCRREVPGQHRTQTEPLRVVESWEWQARSGETYVFERLVSSFTSRQVADPAAASTHHVLGLVGLTATSSDVEQAGDLTPQPAVPEWARRGKGEPPPPSPTRGGGQGGEVRPWLTGVRGATASRLLDEHQERWAERWRAADVQIVGDSVAQRALRFAAYHLMIAADPEDEHVSIGARTLSGEAYRGHVFWDVETYMLPFFIFTWPAAARALLMYRYHTLDGARAKANRMGYRGALYAWESAATGHEATARWVRTPQGEVIPIFTGLRAHHVSADVAYAVWQYWRATADDDFFLRAGAEIVLSTACFWASRAERDAQGRYHIRGVIGPDEYHERVDDSAYTNAMARLNLEYGRETVAWLRQHHPRHWQEMSDRLDVNDRELALWSDVVQRLAISDDPRTGLIEQFAGYFALEDLDLRAYEPRTAAMQVLLGRERIARTQVIKQADVVLLCHLLGDRLDREVIARNFDYYEPRCDHASSLSPSTHALLAARLGRLELARRYFHQAATIDLEDSMGNAALGIHAAACGGLWQVVAFGIAGMQLAEDGLAFDPHLLPGWRSVDFPVQWRGRRLDVAIQAEPAQVCFRLSGEAGPLWVRVGSGPKVPLRPGEMARIDYRGSGPAEAAAAELGGE